MLAETLRIAEKARNEALAGLSAGQREQLMDMMEHVRGNLVALVSAGEPANTPRQEDSTRERRILPTPATRTRRRKATS